MVNDGDILKRLVNYIDEKNDESIKAIYHVNSNEFIDINDFLLDKQKLFKENIYDVTFLEVLIQLSSEDEVTSGSFLNEMKQFTHIAITIKDLFSIMNLFPNSFLLKAGDYIEIYGHKLRVSLLTSNSERFFLLNVDSDNNIVDYKVKSTTNL